MRRGTQKSYIILSCLKSTYPSDNIVFSSQAYRHQTRIIINIYYNIILYGNRACIYVCDVCILMYIRAGVVFGERPRHIHNTIDTPRWLKLTRNIRNDKQVDTKNIYIYILQSERDMDYGRVYI